jgi:hypothetical protein
MRVRGLIISFLVCLFSSCAGSTNVYKAYPGPELGLVHVASLKVPSWVRVGSSDYKLMDCVVDNETATAMRPADDSFLVILPGSHTVSIKYECHSFSGEEKEEHLWATATWNAQAGHTYLFEVGKTDFSLLPLVASSEVIDMGPRHFKEVMESVGQMEIMSDLSDE